MARSHTPRPTTAACSNRYTLTDMAERSAELLRSIYRLRAGFVEPEHAAIARACESFPEVRAVRVQARALAGGRGACNV